MHAMSNDMICSTKVHVIPILQGFFCFGVKRGWFVYKSKIVAWGVHQIKPIVMKPHQS
jgi:hypothetical protein